MNLEGKTMETQKIIREDPDVIEISTPARGGAVKVHGDFNKPDEFKKKIEKAIELRKYSQELLED